jgi:hypothetical protein
MGTGRKGRTLRDNQRLQLPLLRRPLHDLLLDRVRAHEPEDKHRLRLPDTVRAVLRLRVHLWVLCASVSVTIMVREKGEGG